MITKTALKIAVPFPKVESFESYLFIGPHPDDIEIGAGATAAKLVSMGKKVTFLICTDGRYGTDNISGIGPDELAEKRKQESILSAKTLGVSDVRFLELSDGGFYDLRDLEEGIAKTVAEVKPDMVFAPDPDVTSECHKDHLNTGNCAKIICQFSGNPGIMEKYGAEAYQVKAIAFYMTAKPNRYVKTSGEPLKKQFSSIFSCHLTQYPEGIPDTDSLKLYLKLRSAEFGIRSFKGHAEGFRVLGKTHMHCISEAGN